MTISEAKARALGWQRLAEYAPVYPPFLSDGHGVARPLRHSEHFDGTTDSQVTGRLLRYAHDWDAACKMERV